MADRIMIFVYLTLFLLVLMVMVTVGSFARADERSNIISLIEQTAITEGIDPELAVAIAKTESQLRVNAVGSLGEVGLFQLRPEYHKIGNVHENIKTAIKYLAEIKRKYEPSHGDAWFIFYNLGLNYSKPIRYPRLFKYYVRVMKNKRGTYVAIGN